MTSSRADLGAMLHRLTAVVLDLERPLLEETGLQMWDYVVLSRLEHGDAPTQAQLAGASGRDKTRLIPILDRLEGRGYLARTPDPADRRNRVVALTDAGRQALADSRAAVRAMEAEFLADIEPRDRKVFLAVLQRLCVDHGLS